jgi:formylmethanofuran dehydrogenase subunit E
MYEENFNEIEMDCSNCGLKFKMKDMKINPSNNLMVCINCFNMPGSKIKKIR